jgi:transposase-like protein
MRKTKRQAYDAAFKLKAIEGALEVGNRKTAFELGINESMVHKWRQQRNLLETCKKSKKSFRGQKARWPELEQELNCTTYKSGKKQRLSMWAQMVSDNALTKQMAGKE